MAKAKAAPKPKGAKSVPTEVVVTYDLFDLPTAYHKAGLAGLVLVIESLKARNVLTDETAKYIMTPTRVTVTFTEPMVQALMDDVYGARVVEVKVKSKWAGAELKREETVEEEVNGKPATTKRFVYDQVQPKGAFFDNVFDGDKEVWRKLWRDMLWSIPRGRPTTRIPFNECAAGKPCGEGEAVWSDLVKFDKARGKNGFHTAELSSALFPGAQAVNAEGVGFEGRVEQTVLLHFWTFVTLLSVPNVVEADGTSDFAGYALAVPEVGDLEAFVREYPLVLNALKPAPRGYRPAEAVIDVAAEGGLALLNRFAEVTGQTVEASSLNLCIRSVEYIHLVKEGNNIKTMAAGRVSPNPSLLAGYREIVTPQLGLQPLFRNPLFRRGLLLALLDGTEWYRPFGKALVTYDIALFLRQPRKSAEADQKAPPQFAADAATKLRHVSKLFADSVKRSLEMPEAERPKAVAPLPVIVNRVVRNYLLARAAEKSGVQLDAFESDDRVDWSKVPAEYNVEKQKLAMGLMYEFRSRRDQAFVEHFATTFFSVTLRINEADRLVLADALLLDEQRDALKTLTLLSLSANS